MPEFEIGQEWQLVNGETVIIIKLIFEGSEVCRTLGSDLIWRDYKGNPVDKTFDASLSFAKVITDVDCEQTSDFNFRLHDSEIKEILDSLKSNSFFDVLEFGKQVSLATTRRLKAVV